MNTGGQVYVADNKGTAIFHKASTLGVQNLYFNMYWFYVQSAPYYDFHPHTVKIQLG